MVTEAEGRFWFALRVKPRFEKVAGRILQSKGLEGFVPLYKVERRWSDRIKELELPLFSRYIFCRFSPPERLRVLATPGVQSVVGFGAVPLPVADAEIAALQAVMRSGVAAWPWPYLRIGQPVRVEAGPLAGVEGILLEWRNRGRLVVSVTLLQRSVAVEIDRLDVTPVGALHRPFLPPAVPHSLPGGRPAGVPHRLSL